MLNDAAKKLHVKIEIMSRIPNIKIFGRTADVSAMQDLVAKELKDIDKGIVEESHEMMLAKTVQWKYTDSEGNINKFEPSINKVSEAVCWREPPF